MPALARSAVTRPLIIAHRGGAGGHRENSLAAIAAAIDLGVDMVEIDVRRTSDGALVLHHDAEVSGTRIAELTRPEVSQRAGRDLAGLEDALALTAGRIGVNVEIKEDGYVAAVSEAICAHHDPSDVFVTSFIDAVVRQAKELAPRVRVGLLLGRDHPRHYVRTRASEVFPVARARACRADFLAPHWRLLRSGLLARASRAGYRCAPWTINGEGPLARLLQDARVLGVITDLPERAIRLRDRHS